MAKTNIPPGAQLAISTLQGMKDRSDSAAILRAAVQQPGADADFYAVMAEFTSAALAGIVIDVERPVAGDVTIAHVMDGCAPSAPTEPRLAGLFHLHRPKSKACPLSLALRIAHEGGAREPRRKRARTLCKERPREGAT